MRKFLLVLVVLGLVVDRVAHRLVTDEAESRLAEHGLAAATVEIGGFPFSTSCWSAGSTGSASRRRRSGATRGAPARSA